MESSSNENLAGDKDSDGCVKDFFSKFSVVKILNDNVHQKSIFVHGRFGESGEDAVVILEKTPFDAKNVQELLRFQTGVVTDMENDIYKTLAVYPHPKYNGIKSTLICPATEKHLTKYSAQRSFIVKETPSDYQHIVLPYIQMSALSCQWVYNILDKKSEVERIVFEDPDPQTGFLLLPDMKWDGKQTTDLYLVAVVQDRTLYSLRSLTAGHIPLLQNIRQQGLAIIASKYGVPEESIRMFIHYLPSYYHLHIHFTHVDYDAPGIVVGKAHLLDDVIDNLRLMADFYQRKTLTYIIRENDKLYHLYKEAGKL